jgi:hypothetical protein
MSRLHLRNAFRVAFHIDISDLFKDLIWPAAAGNVAWALLQIVVSPAPHKELVLRVVLLSLVAVYLAIDWSRSKSLAVKTVRYWVADFVFVSGIVIFAIALASDKTEAFLESSLASVFLVGGLAHVLGAWETGEKPNWWRRFSLAGCGFGGILALGTGRIICRGPSLWTVLVALALVLAAWIITRVSIEARALSSRTAD